MLLIGIATYNEIESLPQLVPEIFAAAPNCHLLVVDDNSPDGTADWCARYAKRDPRLRCLVRSGKLGLGTATVAILRYAVEHDYACCVTMDADGSHPPQFMRQMLTALERPTPVDVVVGSRYVAGGGIQGWPLRRRVMSRMINWFARAWLGIPVRDTSGAYRVYRVSVLKDLRLESLQSRGYSIFEELLYRLSGMGATMREVPIMFIDRTAGRSKITFREAMVSVWRLVRLKSRR